MTPSQLAVVRKLVDALDSVRANGVTAGKLKDMVNDALTAAKAEFPDAG